MSALNQKIKFSHLLAELIGTLFLVFIGCGSIALSDKGLISGNNIPLAFGSIVCVMIYSLGHISGAHFNPAVTISFAVLKKFSWRRVLPYISAQILGAIIGAFIISLFWGRSIDAAVTQTQTISTGIGSEFLFSFFLMFIITAVATDSRAVGELAGIAIGLTVLISALIGGPLSGASLNPARSIGPALISGNCNDLWLYIIIPIIAAISGSLTYTQIKCEAHRTENHTCC